MEKKENKNNQEIAWDFMVKKHKEEIKEKDFLYRCISFSSLHFLHRWVSLFLSLHRLLPTGRER
jgi:hypothetical protein